MKLTGFNTKNPYLKVPTDEDGEIAPRYVVSKPLVQPTLRCITDRETMQRIVNRYVIIAPYLRDQEGNIIGFDALR